MLDSSLDQEVTIVAGRLFFDDDGAGRKVLYTRKRRDRLDLFKAAIGKRGDFASKLSFCSGVISDSPSSDFVRVPIPSLRTLSERPFAEESVEGSVRCTLGVDPPVAPKKCSQSAGFFLPLRS